MPDRSPKLHFAMLTHGALAATQRAVRSLCEHTPAGFQLHVVDNASSDATPSWLQQQQRHPWWRYQLNSKNRGVPGGRNDLIDFIRPTAADHEWLVFIDNDLEFESGWLAPFLKAIQQYPNARVLGKVGHFITVTESGRDLLPAPCRTGPVDVVSGGFACFVRVDAAKQIGRFDEQLGLFWHEDDDYCVRALHHGFDVVAVPEAAIVHHEHASGVATPDLATGGSLRNLRYLADKWRAAGYVDSDGWIKREHGPFVVRPVRSVLQQRLHRAGGIGRSELAAAITLLEQLTNQLDPATWFDQQRQPIPACLWPLLQLHREHAESQGDNNLANELTDIELVLRRCSNTALLRPMLRGPQDVRGDVPGQGVCRDEDFDSDAFLAAAQQLGLMAIASDPHARSAGLWETLAITTQLLRAGINRAGARVLSLGFALNAIPTWLAKHGTTLDTRNRSSKVSGRYDAILFHHALLQDDIASVLGAHADANTLIVMIGSTTLNGVPTNHTPQPHQIELDLLARAGLQAIAAVNLSIDDRVLEGCATTPGTKQNPMLSRLDGPQVCTSFCVASRLLPVSSGNHSILAPARALAPTTLRVGVDLRTLSHADSTARGIGKFTTQHLAALCDADPGLRLIGYTEREHQPLPKILQRAQITMRSIDDYAEEQVDLMHIPDPMNMSSGFDSPTRVFRHARTTTTFHDLTPLHHYIEHWPQANRNAYLDRLQQLERSNCHLLTNSEFTATDTLAHTSIAKDRVTPILAGLHHDGGQPPSPQQIASVHRQLGIRGPFVLHVGALDPHKNFYASLNAFLMTRASQPLQLVVVGAIDPGMTQAAAFCSKRNVPDVLFTGYLPRPHLDALYASATALLFLSRAEGFGLPILEAMAKGCPVIASDATCHPEVAGSAALLIDADDQAGAAAHIRQLLHDPDLANELRQRGYYQAKSFTWQATAERTLAVWHKMMASAARQPEASFAS